jgi:steroid delta-isomerase-like uncharacterized protein
MSTITSADRELTQRTVEAFLDAHRRRDVAAMSDLCSYDADFNYPGYEQINKQRVVRGSGKVHTIGRPIWKGFARSFPDLDNTVVEISANDDGDAIAQVTVSGTQADTWFTVSNRGGAFSVNTLFVFHVAADGLIDSVAAYWDNASVYRQLGHVEVN